MIVKPSDHNILKKFTKICFQISDSFSLKTCNKYSLNKNWFKTFFVAPWCSGYHCCTTSLNKA